MSGDEAVPASLADPSSVGAKKPSPLIHRHPCATIKAGSKVDNFFPSSYLFKHDFLQIHAPHPFFRASRMLVKRDLKAVKPKALIFDLIGTCCDWYSSLLPALASSPDRQLLSSLELSQLALSWRAGFFNEIHARFQAGKAAEDIDVTHRRVLDRLLHEKGIDLSKWNEEVRRKLVDQWHEQIGESIAAFGAQFADFQCFDKVGLMFFQGSQDCVKNSSCKSSINLQQVSCSSETSVVLANGTTRLQLDIVKSSSLPFHMLFSSELLGLTKPDHKIYSKALELMQLRPDDCIMVAAHVYDLRAAKDVGLGTVYIQRTTEDVGEDMASIRDDVDLFLDGTRGDTSCGLMELADMLCL